MPYLLLPMTLIFFLGSCRPGSGISNLHEEGPGDFPVNIFGSVFQTQIKISAPDDATNLVLTATVGTTEKTLAVVEDTEQKISGRKIFTSIGTFAATDKPKLKIEASGQRPYLRHLEISVQDEVVLATVPEFGKTMTVVADQSDGLSFPRDLAFNPKRPNELWSVNRDSEGVVILQDAGAKTEKVLQKKDSWALHFMAKVSSISFNPDGTFATCHESRNEARSSPDFMGPTMWTSDLSIFAAVNQNYDPTKDCGASDAAGSLQGSHLDMLHQSPLCMGIVHGSGNQYWVFDGLNGNLVSYDFVKDHGPGNSDHSDGKVRRYSDVKLTRVEGVPGHMTKDPKTGKIYVANTGDGTVLEVEPATDETKRAKLFPKGEPLAEYFEYPGSNVKVVAEKLRQPSGLTVNKGRLFVSDHATGEIIAYRLSDKTEIARVKTGAKNIMGITFGPDQKIWFVDAGSNTISRIDP